MTSQTKLSVGNEIKKLNLPIEVKEIALAIDSTSTLKQIGLVEMVRSLNELIAKTHLNCGFEYNQVKVVPTIELLATDLIIEYGTLTYGELEIAFKRGWKGQYGKVIGLSNKTYFEWVNAYFKEESRSIAKKTMQKLHESIRNKPVELTEEEKDQKIRDGIEFSFNEFKAKGHCLIPAAWYDYLKRKEILTITDELREKYKNQAVSELHSEKSLEKTETPRFKMRIDLYIEAIYNTEHVDVISRAKSIAVKEWFSGIIEMEDDIKEILNA